MTTRGELARGELARGELAQRALALHKRGDAAGAARLYRRILKAEPGNVRVLYLFGVANLEQGKFAAGRKALEAALARRPGDPDILFSLGRALAKMGDREAALSRLEAARDGAPERADIWAAIGDVRQQQDRPHEAIAAYARALELAPNDWRVFANAAAVHLSVGNLEQGAAMLRRLADEHPHPKALLNLAIAEGELGNHAAAERLFAQLASDGGGDAEMRAAHAMHLHTVGDSDGAWALVKDLDEAAFQRALPVLAYANIAPRHDDGSQDRTRRARRYAAALAARRSVPAHDRALLYFAVAELCDRLGECDAAFDAAVAASALSPVDYDAAAVERRFDGLQKFFTLERFASLPRATNSSERPVFIVGMPRSGTSLVEQILDCHPDAAGAGELMDIPAIEKELAIAERPDGLAEMTSGDLDAHAERYLGVLNKTSADALRVTDKLPANFARLGLIALLFPRARVIHCVRDPLDTCLSCYFQDFRFRNAYSFSLDHLGHYYARYAAIMRHWRATLPLPILDVRYETLVARPSETIAEMLTFCGLAWDERCLQFHRNPRVVNTASADQVREPLYTRSVGRAAQYRQRLGPLIESLEANGVEVNEFADRH